MFVFLRVCSQLCALQTCLRSKSSIFKTWSSIRASSAGAGETCTGSRSAEAGATWQQPRLVQLVTSFVTCLQALTARKNNRIFYFASTSCGMWIGSCPKESRCSVVCYVCVCVCVGALAYVAKRERASSNAWKQSDLCKLCVAGGVHA